MNRTTENTIHFIAEIGSSHGGDLRHAFSLIDAAVDAGATDIKFQWIRADEIVSPHAGAIRLPNGMTDIYQSFKTVEREYEFYIRAQEHAIQRGVRFFCSVFGTASLADYMRINPDIIKIASPEINHILLLEEIAALWNSMGNSMDASSPHLKIMVSDGMALQQDIQRVATLLPSAPLIILHCVTQYPALPMKYQLRRLSYYQEHFTTHTGISDHTLHPYFLPVISRLCGASYIEKHFTLTKNTKGLDDSFALTPREFATMVEAVHASSQYLAGSSEDAPSFPAVEMVTDSIRTIATLPACTPYPIEPLMDHIPCMLTHYNFDAPSITGFHNTRRSIFSAQNISKGDPLEKSNIQLLRSEQNIPPGIPAELLHHVYGKILNTDVDAHRPITLDMIKEA